MKPSFQQKFYDRMYEGSERSSISPLGKLEKHREEAVYELLPKGKRLLELACGAGNLAIKAADKFDEVVGVDVSQKQIQRAIEKVEKARRPKVEFQVVNVDEGLPFADGFFETVTAVAALAHFYDPVFVVSEVSRVLKKGGTFILQVPNIAYLPRRLALLFGKLPKVSTSAFGWDGGHLHYFTEREVSRLLEKNGFAKERVSCSGVRLQFGPFTPPFLAVI